MNWPLTFGGAIVGFIVGLTGMGGGALMTPMLVFFFNVNPLAAVSSDLVASAVMKPFGSAVHLRNGTVNLKLAGWLMVGSVPSAFVGVLILKALGDSADVDTIVKKALGVALLVASASLIGKAYITMLERVRRRASGLPRDAMTSKAPEITVRPLPTVCIGILGGVVVGMTSVGSGSLIIIALLLLYPTLQASQLVGTDLVQAVPLVAAAALGHLLFGEFKLDVTTSLLIGAIPGVILGAQASSKAPAGIIRRALSVVLLASGLKLLEVSTPVTAVIIIAFLVVGPFVWMAVRKRHGLPALSRQEVRQSMQRQPAVVAAGDASTGDVRDADTPGSTGDPTNRPGSTPGDGPAGP